MHAEACYQRIGRQPKRLCMKFCVHYKCAQPCGWERDGHCSSDRDENNGDRETGERWGEELLERRGEKEKSGEEKVRAEERERRVWSPDQAGLGWA